MDSSYSSWSTSVAIAVQDNIRAASVLLKPRRFRHSYIYIALQVFLFTVEVVGIDPEKTMI